MFTLANVHDEFSNKPAVDLVIKASATDADIESARAALPKSIRAFLRPTPAIRVILNAVSALSLENPAFSARFVLP